VKLEITLFPKLKYITSAACVLELKLAAVLLGRDFNKY